MQFTTNLIIYIRLNTHPIKQITVMIDKLESKIE